MYISSQQLISGLEHAWWMCVGVCMRTCLFPLDVRIFCISYIQHSLLRSYSIIKISSFNFFKRYLEFKDRRKAIWEQKYSRVWIFPHSFSLNKIFFNELPLAGFFFQSIELSLMKTNFLPHSTFITLNTY